MAAGGIEVARAYVTIIPSLEGSQKTISQELGAAVDKEGPKAGKSLGQKLLDGTGSILKTGGKILGGLAITAATTATAAVVGITKEALSSFKDYEQLTGGVEKLFGDSAKTVMANASQAYATAGLDANAYMEQITSVSASLIASLEGDTEAAAKVADMAIQDMSDNANVFGSDIQSIQNAYSGFAKGNYGMLDNLKLGYQGTKDEMQRLLDDAEKISGIHYELGNYADMVEAIHVIQDEMGIMGTTANEALGTIEGSMNMTKSAWSNFITALAGGGDIAETLDGLKTSIFGVEGASNGLVNNVLPVIQSTIGAIISVLPSMVSSFMPTVISTVQSIIPQIVTLTGQLIPVIVDAIAQFFGSGFSDLLNTITASIPDLVTSLLSAVPVLINALGTIITSLIQAITSSLPKILKSITSMLPTIIRSILDNLQSILTAIVEAIPDILVAIIEALTVIVDMLPEIIQMIIDILPELLTTIIDALLGNIDIIIQAIITLTMSILEALPDILIMLVDALPGLVLNIVDAIMASLPDILVAIVDLIGQIVLKLPEILLTIAEQFLKLFGFDIPLIILNALSSILTSLWDGLTAMIQKVAEFEAIVIDSIAKWLADIIMDAIDFWSDIFDKVKNFFTELFDTVKEKLNNIFTTISTVFGNILSKAKEVFNNVKTAITTPIEAAKTTLTNIFNNVKTTITTIINNIKTTVTNVFNAIKTAITSPIDTAKNLVSSAIQTMKNLFSGAWPTPSIKLPHFSISGSFSINPPSIPHLSVSWYGKGYDEAQILKGATIFGMNTSGDLLAGGERGPEVVVGEEHLLDLISKSVPKSDNNIITVNVYASEGQDEETLAQKVIEKIQDLTDSREVVYA